MTMICIIIIKKHNAINRYMFCFVVFVLYLIFVEKLYPCTQRIGRTAQMKKLKTNTNIEFIHSLCSLVSIVYFYIDFSTDKH